MSILYPVNSINDSYKIAVVADLHERGYSEILATLEKIHPDYIVLPGDTLERREEGVQGHKKKKLTSGRILLLSGKWLVQY